MTHLNFDCVKELVVNVTSHFFSFSSHSNVGAGRLDRPKKNLKTKMKMFIIIKFSLEIDDRTTVKCQGENITFTKSIIDI